MKKINQLGFSPVVVLLALILVVLVGFTGYYVYNTQKKDDKAAAPSPPAKSIATTNQSSTQDTQKYLVIKEWGVKIPVSEKYVDVTYKMGNDFATFQSETFARLTNQECSAKNSSEYLGGINRYDESGKNPEISEGPGSAASAAAVKVGNHYYDYVNPTQMYCQETPANANGQQKYFMEAIEYLRGQIKQIQAQ